MEVIRNHLNLVFKHEIDPIRNDATKANSVDELNDAHEGFIEPGSPSGPWTPGGHGNDTLVRC